MMSDSQEAVKAIQCHFKQRFSTLFHAMKADEDLRQGKYLASQRLARSAAALTEPNQLVGHSTTFIYMQYWTTGHLYAWMHAL